MTPDPVSAVKRTVVRLRAGIRRGTRRSGLAPVPLLTAADRMVNTTRQGSYGAPEVNMARIAMAWSAVLRRNVTPEQVALCLVAMKVVRAGGRQDRDDLVDAAAYLDIADRCRNR